MQAEGLLKSSANPDLVVPEEFLKENSPAEFVSYATGRANVAFFFSILR